MLGSSSLTIKNYLKSYNGLSKSCWEGIFLNCIVSSLTGVFYFLSLYFVKILHFNIALVGTIISFYGIGAILGGFIGGKTSDKISPRIVSAVMLLIQAIGYLALIKLTSANWLKVDVLMLGAATYSFLTANYVWILNQAPDEAAKLKAINILSAGANLGLGLSMLIIGTLFKYGFHRLFLVSSILFFICTCYLLLQRDITINQFKNIATTHNDLSVTNKLKNVTWFMLLCVFFVGLIVSQMNSIYPIYLQSTILSLNMRETSILFSLNPILIVLFQVPFVNYFNKSNKILMAGIGAFLLGFGMFILCLSSTFIIAVLSRILYTIGEMLFFSMSQLVCYEKGAMKKKGHSLGAYRMFYASSRAIGPALGGLIYYHCGGSVVWYLSGSIGVLCLIASNHYKKFN